MLARRPINIGPVDAENAAEEIFSSHAERCCTIGLPSLKVI
jgi:hypothetical protein